MSGNTKSIIKTEEPLVSYERVLLSQIDYCGKVSDVQYPTCVDNLFALLPTDIKTIVANKYNQVLSVVLDYVVAYAKEKGFNCCKEYSDGIIICHCDPYTERISAIASLIKENHPDLYLRYRHVIKPIITYIFSTNSRIPTIAFSILMYTIIIDTLLEHKIIAPSGGTIHIGRVEG